MELSISSRVDVNAFCAVVEGELKQHGDENAEEVWYENAALFYPVLTEKDLDVSPLKQTVLCMST